MRLAVRNLPAATRDSCWDSQPFRFDFFEGPSVRLQCGLLAGEGLPPLEDHVHVLGVKLYPVTYAPGQFGRDQRGAAAEEWVVNHGSAFGVVQDRPAHQ